MQGRHSVHDMQQSQNPPRTLLTALEVQQLLHIDRSTVYRMAEDGRLPAIRVGRSWRFPAERIEALLGAGEGASATSTAGPEDPSAPPLTVMADASGSDAGSALPGPRGAQVGARAPEPAAAPGVNPAAAAAAVEVAADLLGVMMVVTDMHGRPMTDVAHPCEWFTTNADDPEVLDRCVAEWHDLADHPDLTPRFQEGALGFQCARAFIRHGSTLVGMVLAGGVSASSSPDVDPDLYHLDEAQRQQVLTALPRIAAAISTTSTSLPGATPTQAPHHAAAATVPTGAATKEN